MLVQEHVKDLSLKDRSLDPLKNPPRSIPQQFWEKSFLTTF